MLFAQIISYVVCCSNFFTQEVLRNHILEPMAVFSQDVKGAIAAILASTEPLNIQKQRLYDVLDAANLSHFEIINPADMAIHPDNRGGIMVNKQDVHDKGSGIVGSGADLNAIGESVCLDMANSAMRSKYIAANEKLVAESDGMLAPMTGQERFVAAGTCHTVSFCRAIKAGCVSPHKHLTSDGTHLSLDAMGASSASHPLNKMCNVGWRWRVISGELEEHFPGIVIKLTQSCNTPANVIKGASEFECALVLAALITKTKCSVDSALATVRATQPKCQAYLGAIGDFVKLYAGGNDFPLLHFLKAFQSKYAAAVNVGEVFMSTLASQEFSHPSSTCPFSRVALLATQLTSLKVQDSIAKLLGRSDITTFAKLKDLVFVESLLASAWNVASNLINMSGYSLFGTYCTRVMLHVLKKENLGREPGGHADLDAITSLFAAAVEKLKGSSISSQASAVPASSGSSSASAASAAAAEPTELVSLVDSANPAQMVMKKFKLQIGSRYVHSRYVQDKDQKCVIYTLDSVDSGNNLVFKHKCF